MTTPTRDIDERAPRIGDKRELVERLASGCKPSTQWRVGTEHEKFGFQTADLAPVPYEGEASIRALLEGMAARFGWKPIEEAGRAIGLKRDLASISLEPGGQFELSGAPLETMHETRDEIAEHLAETRTIAEPLGLGFFGLGFSPLWSLDETPTMPKGRYAIMRAYMQKVGRLGREMMFRTCTVQANLDYASEADMVKKLRVGVALQPVVTALFANSPFAEGRANGFLSYRAHIWSDTDPDRTGMLPFAFESGFGFEQYVDFALDVPMYFVRRSGKYVDCSGQSFRDFLQGRLPALPGELPAMDDFDDHLSTIFPEVRLKTFLEMRGADAGPEAALTALPALWTGLLYDTTSLDAAWDLVKGWSWREREAMRRCVPSMGFNTPLRSSTLHAIAQETVAIAREGLKRRARRNAAGHDESIYLADLQQIADSGVTPAEDLLRLYRTEWGRDVRKAIAARRM